MTDSDRAQWRERVKACLTQYPQYDGRVFTSYLPATFDEPALDAVLAEMVAEARADAVLKIGQWQATAAPPPATDHAALAVLGARVLAAWHAEPGVGPAFSSGHFADAVDDVITDSGLYQMPDYATPAIAATVARLTGGPDATS